MLKQLQKEAAILAANKGRWIMRKPEVKKTTGLTDGGIFRAIQDMDFPAPVHLGRRAVGWHSHEVFAWIDSRPRRDTFGELIGINKNATKKAK